MSTENRPIDAESSMKVVRVAVEGCCHGQLNKIYQSVPKNAELLIICGDFQAIRNQQDLKSMNVPAKYREMGDFPDYYSGKKRAPIMTIFIGGNHESSSYMRELQYGGWVAPDIYYLGEYGTIWYKGMRISGLSGIHSYPSFVSAKSNNPPVYTLPYGNSAIRSIYHIKPKNFLKLLLSGSSNIVLSHDWPKGIWDWGNKERLLKNKPFLKADMESGHFGSPLASQALEYLRPANWFSSHMHTFFDATVKHKDVEEKEEKEGEAEGLEDINDAKRRKTSGEAEATKEATKEDNNEISLDMDDMDDMSEMDNDQKIAGISPKSPTKNNNEISLDMDEELEPEKSANQENLQIPPKEVPPSVSEVSEVSEVSKASDTNKSESKNEATTSKEQETNQHQHQQKQNKEQKKKHKKKQKKVAFPNILHGPR
ncbi:hypothetical protein JCM33374_g3289 [Metschnikowia sp. JCM 33374]|nr:hypothetical protein JCM33374_g3289 [Metschnikowia sp. JCM 33374]